MYIIRAPPMSTRLAKDSARAVVASEQMSVTRASNFTKMCFMSFTFSFHFPRSMLGSFHSFSIC